MSGKELLIQAIGFLGTGLFFLSYQFRDNRTLFRVQFFSYLCYTVHLLCLGAVTGGISYLINLLRSYALSSDRPFLQSKKMCAILCAAQLLALVLSWDGALSVLPVAANIASTLGGYSHSPRKVRLAGMLINSPLWIVYDLAVGSWAGILDEAISELSMLVSLLRFGWKEL